MDIEYQQSKHFYETEAQEINVFGSIRELFLNEQILSAIKNRPQKVIDIGCGDGALLFDLAKKYRPEIVAFDLTWGRLCNTLNNNKQAKAVQGNVIRLPFKDNSFDLVICSEVLEHIPDYQATIKELIRITKDIVIVTVPNEQALDKMVCPHCHKIFYACGHVNSFSARQMRELLSAYSGVTIKKIKRFHTIYSYNRTTMKLWPVLRLWLDSLVVWMYAIFDFFKPNFMLVVLEKTRRN